MSWMIDENDPARQEIVERAMTLGITGTPEKASHALGEITLADGKKVNAHVIHAADAIITNGTDAVFIERANDPGKGKPALPGGFIDPTAEGSESLVQAAAREAMEEAGIELGAGAEVGTRNFNRPYDVRVVQGEGLAENYGVHDGDVFMVSTQAIRFDVPDLEEKQLTAGDDAAAVSTEPLSDITKDTIGIPDHYDMLVEAVPEAFEKRTRADGKSWVEASGNKDDIQIG